MTDVQTVIVAIGIDPSRPVRNVPSTTRTRPVVYLDPTSAFAVSDGIPGHPALMGLHDPLPSGQNRYTSLSALDKGDGVRMIFPFPASTYRWPNLSTAARR